MRKRNFNKIPRKPMAPSFAKKETKEVLAGNQKNDEWLAWQRQVIREEAND